jgi:hypothetical protein
MTWQAWQQIEAGDFAAAKHAYRAILDNFPDDTVAKHILKECEERRADDLAISPQRGSGQPAHEAKTRGRGRCHAVSNENRVLLGSILSIFRGDCDSRPLLDVFEASDILPDIQRK